MPLAPSRNPQTERSPSLSHSDLGFATPSARSTSNAGMGEHRHPRRLVRVRVAAVDRLVHRGERRALQRAVECERPRELDKGPVLRICHVDDGQRGEPYEDEDDGLAAEAHR